MIFYMVSKYKSNMAATPVIMRTVVPTVDLSDNITPKNIVVQSPQEHRYVTYPATSFSQSNAVFNIIPLSPSIIISRYIRVNMPLRFTIQAFAKQTSLGTFNVINSLYAGLCQYSLHQMIATLTVQFNNQSVAIRPSQIIDKFMHYSFDREAQKSSMSTTTTFPDQANDYSQLTGTITSEFASYGSFVDHISRNTSAYIT